MTEVSSKQNISEISMKYGASGLRMVSKDIAKQHAHNNVCAVRRILPLYSTLNTLPQFEIVLPGQHTVINRDKLISLAVPGNSYDVLVCLSKISRLLCPHLGCPSTQHHSHCLLEHLLCLQRRRKGRKEGVVGEEEGDTKNSHF